MNKQVLVTGAAGFIGRAVVKHYVQQGDLVSGMGHGCWNDYRNFGLVGWHESSVTLEALKQYGGTPDIIIHCGGGSLVGLSVDEPRQDFCKTVDSTSQLLEFMRLYSPDSRLVYISSAAVYGQVEELPIKECSVTKPVSPYGVHKWVAEELCRLYSRQYQLKISVIRFFSVYGEGLKKQLLWDACQKLVAGNAGFFGTGDETRDWLHVSDAVKLISIAANNASDECCLVNGGSGQGVAVRDLISTLKSSLGVKVQTKFTGQQKKGDPKAYIADTSTARKWGWEPLIDLQQGVKLYSNWFLEQ